MGKILIIDDDESIRNTLELYLRESGYNILLAENGAEGLKMLEQYSADVIICDVKMPGMNGIEVLQKVKEFDNHIPVIIITAFEDMNTTIKAMQNGAYDYLTKPIDSSRFSVVVKRAIESKNLSERLAIAITGDLEEFDLDDKFVGKSDYIKDIYKKIGQVSLNTVNILIQGESGTGKELIARTIHYSGITKNQPFIAVNCSALTESLLESELFGHVKGAFTGAIKDKKGKFELAGEGTIFLDEISEISPELQVKLLRIIQERKFEKVGGELSLLMKARIIAATNRDLNDLVEMRKFRDDLFYRLNVFPIFVPPLRDRREDIPTLIVHLLKKINRNLHKNVRKIPWDVMEMLQNHYWVGNVRELENTLLQAVVLAKGDVLEKNDILIKEPCEQSSHKTLDKDLTLAEIEKKHIEFILNKVGWNKQEACRILGITKPTLYKKISSYHLEQNLDLL